MPQEGERKKKVALILGSGFSATAGVPTANKLPDVFLTTPRNSWLPSEADELINKVLRMFWTDVFDYSESRRKPSLEDHFTVLDLAANSGHNIGPLYGPKELRAIRRMSIHRIFQILNQSDEPSDIISRLMVQLNEKFSIIIATLNWDIVIEKHLFLKEVKWDYGIETYNFHSAIMSPNKKCNDAIQLYKLHGSSHWVYCDCCRRIITLPPVIEQYKLPLLLNTYLQRQDFKLFSERLQTSILKETLDEIFMHNECFNCNGPLSGRLATFSFRKDLSPAFLQTIWDGAYRKLQEADTWLFIGYSLPDADFEFKHLLKSAQYCRRDPSSWSCEVILKSDQPSHNDPATDRYSRFFGIDVERIYQHGLTEWVRERLDNFCQNVKS